MISETVSIGIVLNIVFTVCLLIGIAWTIDFGWYTCMHSNCWDICFQRPSINWNCPDNRDWEGSVIWKLAATTVEYNWFGQYTIIPRYYCLYTRMRKSLLHPIICKVLPQCCIMLYFEWYRFNGGCLSIQMISTRSWIFSRNSFRGWPLKLIVLTFPINFHPPKSIVPTIPISWQHSKSIAWTIPFNRQHLNSCLHNFN